MGKQTSMGMLMAAALLLAGAAQAAGVGPRHQPGWPLPVNERVAYGKLFADRLERVDLDEAAWVWDAQGWYGTDRTRVWVETEGEQALGRGGELERLDVQWSRLVAPYWDLQLGVGYRRSWGADGGRRHWSLVGGLQGLAPYWFEVDAKLRIEEEAGLGFDLEAEHDLRLTQRLYLQPRLETRLAARAAPGLGQGAGLNHLQLGLRLRYELRREFAPYLGWVWRRAYGGAGSALRAEGLAAEASGWVAGLRVWY